MRPSNVLRFKEKLNLNPEGLVTGSAKLDANKILSDFGIWLYDDSMIYERSGLAYLCGDKKTLQIAMLLFGGHSWKISYSEYVSLFGMFFSFFSKRRNIEVLALDGNRGMNISGLFVGMDKLRNLTLKFCYINTVFKFNSPTLLSSVQIQELITFTLLQLESCFFAYAVRV